MDVEALRAALAEGRAALRSSSDRGTVATRSGGHVAPIHRFVASELVRHGLPRDWVAPDVDHPQGRYWSPDVRRLMESLVQSKIARSQETCKAIDRFGEAARRGRRQPYGAYHQKEVDVSASLVDTGPLVVVSVKAPTSSVAKNAVNRYEESIGEATNLHSRFPMLVFGFLMVLGAEPGLMAADGSTTATLHNIQRLIVATSARRAVTDPPGAYEAAGLVLVDYAHDPPAIVPDVPAAGSPLRIEGFFEQLMDIFWQRNRAIRLR